MKRCRRSVNIRQAKTLSLIRERQKVSVEALAEEFHVSLMTVRRDLQLLESKGLISRFYGGASTVSYSAAGAEKEEAAQYRRLISCYAASLVSNDDDLFINGSRTALDLLDYTEGKSIHVFTNNGIAVGREFPPSVSVTLSGGTIHRQSGVLTGDGAMRNLLMAQAKKAFIGCVGISPGGEILCGIPSELGINETMISHAQEYFILADFTKVGKVGTYASCSLEKMGTVITDERASASIVEQLRTIGMKVIQVQKNGSPKPIDP